MATIVVDQNLEDIKEIEWYDKTSNLRVSLNEWQFPTNSTEQKACLCGEYGGHYCGCYNGEWVDPDQNNVEWRKAYTLTIPPIPEGVSFITIKRTSSEMTDVSTKTWTAADRKSVV